MAKLFVLNIINGNFEQGFSVILQMWEEGKQYEISYKGNLPPAPKVPKLYQLWQTEYLALIALNNLKRLGTPKRNSNSEIQKTTHADFINAVNQKAQELINNLNQWLNSETFRFIKEKLLAQLQLDEPVRIIIETDEPVLRRLPWYLWDLFNDFTKAEVAVSLPNYQRRSQVKQERSKVRILGILGDCSHPITQKPIDIKVDQQLINNLPDVEAEFLLEPEREKINDQLWQQGWNILFFAGHSSSNEAGTTGKIYINSSESLTIEQLKYAVSQAIASGLQLAIFNSCDGLGIAFELAALHIPQTIVMREPVPDFVAQQFLKYFLHAYAGGKSLYLAVREARERLHGLEKDFPCASWLPVICQNPAEIPPTWQSLRGIEAGINWREVCFEAVTTKRKLTTNHLTTGDGVEFGLDEIYVPLGLVERQKKERRAGDVAPEEGSRLYAPEEEYEVTRTYQNDQFFEQVLQRGDSHNSKGRRLAVIGEPGAGKTTLLQKIGDWVFNSTQRDVAIWVSLADLQGRSLEEYLLQKWLKDALGVVQVTPEKAEALAELFKNGRVWLLLDGVDEMADANPLYSIASQITGWVATAKVVLTCRLNVWDAGKNALQGFDIYRNLDFEYPKQVEQFINKWFTPRPPLVRGARGVQS